MRCLGRTQQASRWTPQPCDQQQMHYEGQPRGLHAVLQCCLLELMYLLCQLQQRQHCLQLLSVSWRVQLHQLHRRMHCHGLQVAVVTQLTLQVKGQTLQELCCYVAVVPSMSVVCVLKQLTPLLMACTPQDQSQSLLCLLLHLHIQQTGVTVIMSLLFLICCSLQQCHLVLQFYGHLTTWVWCMWSRQVHVNTLLHIVSSQAK